MARILPLLMVLFLLSAPARADVLVFKDGRRIVGKIVYRGARIVTIKVRMGGVYAVVSYTREDILRITGSAPARSKPEGAVTSRYTSYIVPLVPRAPRRGSTLMPHGFHPMEELNYRYYRSGPPAATASFKGLQWRRGLLPPVSK